MKNKVVRIDFTSIFDKQLQKAPIGIKKAFRNRLLIFRNDQFHPLLHNHALMGNYHGFRSINISGDWRALYKEVLSDKEEIIVEFRLLGTHSQLYKK